jgi:lysophospholipase L1-like esterase
MAERQVDLAAFLTADGIHLTAEGNRMYGEMVFAGLPRLALIPVASR